MCEGELCQLRDDYREFEEAGVQVLAVSCDSRHAQRVWAEQQGYKFPVLSDFWPHGAVAQAYGVFNEELGAPTGRRSSSARTARSSTSSETDSWARPASASRYTEALAKL